MGTIYLGGVISMSFGIADGEKVECEKRKPQKGKKNYEESKTTRRPSISRLPPTTPSPDVNFHISTPTPEQASPSPQASSTSSPSPALKPRRSVSRSICGCQGRAWIRQLDGEGPTGSRPSQQVIRLSVRRISTMKKFHGKSRKRLLLTRRLDWTNWIMWRLEGAP